MNDHDRIAQEIEALFDEPMLVTSTDFLLAPADLLALFEDEKV